ncbi:hypothetical protein TNCV_1035541 [Trichonephila clavipes]|nr:hypothetical protein TNCV_1035541 [Trichonephila clavipes]
MPKRKRGLTTEEIQKLLIDLEDEIFDDSDSDCELENEEDLDQSINFNVVAEDELISQEQNEIFGKIHKYSIKQKFCHLLEIL